MKLSKKLFQLLFISCLAILLLLLVFITICTTIVYTSQYKKNLNATIRQNGELINAYLYRLTELFIYPQYNDKLYTLLTTDVDELPAGQAYYLREQISTFFFDNVKLPLREYVKRATYCFAVNEQFSTHRLFLDETEGEIVSAQSVKDESWMQTNDIRITYTRDENDPDVALFSRTLFYDIAGSKTRLGVLKFSVPMSGFIDNLSGELISENNLFYMISPENQIYKIFGDESKNVETDLLLSIQYDKYQYASEKQKIGNTSYFMSAMLVNQSWKLVGYSPCSRVFLDALPIYVTIFLVICASIGFVFIFAYRYVPKVICEPISHLIDTMNQEDYSLIEEKSFYEVEVLNRAYNHFATHTQQLIQEIIRETEKTKNMEIKALQAQINPHFMYNTLDSINCKIMKYDDEVPEIINALSSILRYSISSPEKLVPLDAELEIVRSFIDIERFCYDFELEFSADASHLFGSVYVPKLTLQPLVENAIIHAILEQDEPQGRIDITTETDEKHLYVHVKNTGKPVDIDQINALLQEADTNEKHGIRNVNGRIKILYGDEYGLRFSRSEQGETIATVILPLM